MARESPDGRTQRAGMSSRPQVGVLPAEAVDDVAPNREMVPDGDRSRDPDELTVKSGRGDRGLRPRHERNNQLKADQRQEDHGDQQLERNLDHRSER